MIAILLTLAAPTLSYQLSASAAVTPVQKVLAMMNEMKAKGTAEMEKEAKLFKEYMSWCDVMKDEKETAIKEAGDMIAKLSAHEMKAHADAVTLGDQVTELDTEIASFSQDKKENKEVRTLEHDDYVEVHDDTTANIDATHAAISKLTAASGDVQSFLQEDVTTMPMTSKELVQSLLEENAIQQQPQATVKAFEGSSGGILKTMEDMEGDMTVSREKSEYEESDERHAYDMEQGELTDSIEVDDDRATDKTVKKSEKKEEEAHDHGDVVALTEQKGEDEKYLAELLAQCESKENDFESRQKLRGE